MIHARRGSGTTTYKLAFGVFAVALLVVVLAASAGMVAFGGFEIRWKSVVILGLLAAFAVFSRVRGT